MFSTHWKLIARRSLCMTRNMACRRDLNSLTWNHSRRLSPTVTPVVTALSSGRTDVSHCINFGNRHARCMSNNKSCLSDSEVKRKIDEIADSFMEARELLEDAREVKDTVYFSEDMAEAVEAVDNTLKKYSDLLSNLTEEQKLNVLRTIGLKMEELRAQKNALEEEIKHE